MFHVKQLPREHPASGKITLSKEGVWRHEGVEITHERTIELFNKSLFREGERYVLLIGREKSYVDVEDAPFIVKQVDCEDDRLVLSLSNSMTEELDPATLEVGKNNVLYARVGPGKDRARFTRPAYYQLAHYFQEGRDGNYVLKIGEREFLLAV